VKHLKIGIVAPLVVKSATGQSNYVAELVPGLCDAGHRVTVMATNCAYRGAPADEVIGIDSRATLKLFPSRGRLNRRIYRSPELCAWMYHNMERFDVVDIQGIWYWSVVHAARACTASHVPYVITPHGNMGRWDWAKRPWGKRIFFRTMLGNCWRSAATVRYFSQGELQQSVEPPAAPAVIIPAAITLPPEPDPAAIFRIRSKLQIPASAPLVVFLGRVNPQKGVLELVQAFDLVRQRCPKAVLVIAGQLMGTYGQEVQQLATTVSSGTHIRVLGAVSAADKWAMLAAGSVFVTLSRNEGMSSAMLEALGSGMPTVCTADSNLPEISEFAAGIVTKLDPTIAAGAIASLLESDQQRRTMGANARRMVSERFTWNSVLPQLTALYESLADGVGRGQSDPVTSGSGRPRAW